MREQLHYRKYQITIAFLFIVICTYSQPTLLKDIYLGPTSSADYFQFTKIGDRVVFVANDDIHGNEQWLTDGTTSGTMRLLEYTGILKDTIYTRGGNGLFKTNGNEINFVFANMGFTLANQVTKVNETWFFVANIDTQNREELWKSDGTEAGTVLVKKIRPNSFNSAYTSNLIAAPNGTDLYFSANDGSGMALWKSDGTTDGTIKIKYFSNTPDYRIGNFVNYNNQTFFWAYNSSGFDSLWKTDGTLAGTVLVQEKLSPSFPQGRVIVYNNKIYFQGQRQVPPFTYGNELWVSDGTNAGTYMFFDIDPTIPDTTAGGSPEDFQIVNNLLMFQAKTELNGYELWITNGTENGTFMLNDVYPGTNSGVISYSKAVNEINKLFFTGFDGNQRMLWETDGTVLGTIPLYDISESDLPIFTSTEYINNRVIFMKETIANGKELWSFNPTLSFDAVEYRKNANIYPNPATNYLTVETPFTGNLQLKVINNLGQLVLKQNQDSSKGSLDVSNLSRGLYFLNIHSETGENQTIKFIKN